MSGDSYRMRQIAAVNELQERFDDGNRLLSTVEKVSDYTDDGRVCLTAIAFVGDQLAHKLEPVIAKLRAISPEHHYYSSDALHLTIQNVRVIASPPNFDDSTIENAKVAFRKIVPEFSKQHFELSGLLVMPSSAAVVAYGENDFFELCSQLRESLRAEGIPDDKDYIRDDVVFGNVTFCRYTEAPSYEFLEELKCSKDAKFGSLVVDRVHLVAANSVLAPGYTKLLEKFYFK
ncbi:MAG: hypothetical protein IAF58_15935 [Leptolyngbya sp.]|nr:hypothetical protein [Candidatus Melainabacteria bacterium]